MTASAPDPSPRTRSAAQALTAAVGFGAGLLNGLLGVGGGIIIVPGLILLRNLVPRTAVVTSLGAVLVLAALALVAHVGLAGFAPSTLGTALLLGGGVLGSRVGSVLLLRMPQRGILFLFAGFTVVASTHLILQSVGAYAVPPAHPPPPPLWSYPLVGGAAGFFSGMLGVGGGGIVVLSYATLFHTTILGSLPLALLVNIVNAGAGVHAHRGRGELRWRMVAALVPAAVVGIAVGVWAAVWMPPGMLKVLFAVFFVYMGGRLFKRGLRM